MRNEDPSIEALVRAGVSSMTQCDRPCPFCHTEYENINDMHLHVAYHLERFSIFALPRSHHLEKDEGISDGEGGSSHANILRNESLGADESMENLSLTFESQPSLTENSAAHSVTAEELRADTHAEDEYWTVDISVPHHDHEKLFMRARLDSGMEDNAISEEKALETGFEIEPYTGRDIIVGNGDTFRPVGYIDLQFHFQKVQAAKSWKLRFLVIPNDPPFDVAFGRNFIFKAKLFVRPTEALPME